MSSRVEGLRVFVDSADRDAYRLVFRRSPGVELTDSANGAGVVVTGDAGLAGESAARGAHVLLERPWLLPASALDDLEHAGNRAGARLMPAHVWRFSPAHRAVREALDAGSLGAPALLRVHCWSCADETERLFRLVDLALWVFGQQPEIAHCVSRHGLVQAHLGFEDDGMALLDDVADLPPGESYSSLSIIGVEGAAYADDHRDVHLLFGGGRPAALRGDHAGLSFSAQLAELIGAVREAREPSVTLDDVRAAFAAVAVLQESSSSPPASEPARTTAVSVPRADPEELSPSARPLRALVLSVVKHDYIARAVAAHPRFELVAVADDADCPDWVHERNREFAACFELPYVADVERAIREHGPDVAVVSSQAERHCDLAVRAARAGLHIIVDKPLSTRLSECDRLVEAVREAGVKCLLWNRNFHPALLDARNAIERGEIGELRAIHCDFYFSKDSGPRKGSRRPGDPPIVWLERQIEAHADGSDGGVGVEPMGELQNEGIYPLAQIRMLAGFDVRRVFARAATVFHQAHADNDVEDIATVSLELAGGVTATLSIGRIGAASHPDIGEIKLHIVGSRGALVVAEPRPEVAVYYRGQPPSEFRHRRVANENDALLLDDLVRAIEADSETVLDAGAGRTICALLQAALESARIGRVLDFLAN